MVHETTKRDPERIYLEPWPYSPEGRLWSEEDVWPLYTWPPEPEGESERATGVEYIRADLHAAEIARLTRELEEARAENRRLRGALERVADGGCERFAGTDCWQMGMDPNAKDYADRVCDPCFARLALATDMEGGA